MSVYITNSNVKTEDAIWQILKVFKSRIDLSKGVFLKPNIVFPVREKKGEITKHKIVRVLIGALRKLDPKVEIIIGEGTAAGTVANDNFRVSGYSELAKELKVQLLDLNQLEQVKLKWKYGVLWLPKIAFEKTYINLPILKVSSTVAISGAMKNQKGLLLPDMKKHFHKLGLHEPIAYLNKLVQPALSIMDGVNFFGKGILISGDNTYEIDRLMTNLIRIPEPYYIKMAKDIGVGDEEFDVLGTDIGNIKSNFKYEHSEYKKLFRIRVWSNHRACSMCRYVFLRIKKTPLEDIKYTILMYLKLLKYALTGAEVLFGLNPHFEVKYKNVICIGNCTKKLAKEKGYHHIPGCPPTKEEMLRYF